MSFTLPVGVTLLRLDPEPSLCRLLLLYAGVDGDLVDLGDLARYPSVYLSMDFGVKSKLGYSRSCEAIQLRITILSQALCKIASNEACGDKQLMYS